MKLKYGKVIWLLAALLLIFTLPGCNSRQNEPSPRAEQTEDVGTVANEPAASVGKTVQDGTPSGEAIVSDDAGAVSIDDAKSIALNHAGLSAGDVTFVIAEFDDDVFVPHYDIEFAYGGYEYDYEISAATGAIMDFDKEPEDNDEQANVDASDFITAESAKDIALGHAELSANDISGYECELDTDDLIPHYEIEFTCGKYEYEYEINAKTGNIMFSEKEIDD